MSGLDDIIGILRGLPDLGPRIARQVGPELHAAVAKTLEAGQSPEGQAWAPKVSGGRAYKNAASRVSFGVDGAIVRLVLKGPEVWGHLGVRGRPVRQMLPDAGAELPRSVVRAIETGAAKVLAEVTR